MTVLELNALIHMQVRKLWASWGYNTILKDFLRGIIKQPESVGRHLQIDMVFVVDLI